MPSSFAPITRSTPLTDLISYLQAEVHNLTSGEEFMMKDLFLGYEWSRIDSYYRRRLGSLFFAFVSGEGAALIKPLGKTTQQHQRYRKR
jgi:hypothetical protein